MRRWKASWAFLLVLSLLLLSAVPVKAEEGQDQGYTYTVRIFAGKQGTYQGAEYQVFSGLKPGDTVNFLLRDTALKDNSKYYVKGIRLSGRDSSTGTTKETETATLTVEGDADYVISYGILGDMTSYTIEYVDTDGDALAPSETYYGNVGDKPVIAYLYIDGYRPQAYNLTRTLDKDAGRNIFRFVYTRVQTPGGSGGGFIDEGGTDEGETGPGFIDEGTVTVVQGADAAAGAAAAAGGAGAGTGGAADDGGAVPDGGAGQADGGVSVPDEDVPATENLMDLDDEEVPMSELPSLFSVDGNAALLGVPVSAVAAAGAAVMGGLIWIFRKRKKKEKKEEE